MKTKTFARWFVSGLLAGGLLLSAAGCRAQVPPNPVVYVCPSSSGTAYAPLNQSTPATGLAYTDATPTPGEYCYVAQSVVASTGQVSTPSNIAGPFDVTTGKSVLLTWTAAATGPTPPTMLIGTVQ